MGLVGLFPAYSSALGHTDSGLAAPPEAELGCTPSQHSLNGTASAG